MGFKQFLSRHWYDAHPASALLPLAGLYGGISAVRRWAYRRGVLHRQRLPVPVIVVGNITVGGSGKTPMVIWLAALLRAHGWTPGIVSRGYGGRAPVYPQRVRADSDPAVVGDEPVLLARRTGCPLAVAPDRVAAARALMGECDVLLCDDGLQHDRLARDIEIVVIDGVRRFGNGHLLPAGPLREPVQRLASVDYCIVNGGCARAGEYAMSLVPGAAYQLSVPTQTRPLSAFSGQTVHAVAGIGHPPRFFATLRSAGLTVIEHPFPDHHPYCVTDLSYPDTLAVFMSEKDAVKCRARVNDPRYWVLPVEAHLPPALDNAFLERMRSFHG